MIIHTLTSRFQQRLTAAGGEFHLVESLDQAAEAIATHHALDGGESGTAREVVVPSDFASREPWGSILPLLTGRDITIREAGDVVSIADAPAGLSNAELAVAETGSVLIAENSIEARAVTMLTLTHFVLVREQDLVPMLDDAGARIQQLAQPGPRQRHHISLVTGPSRTADIERTLTIGVQGPKALCAIMVRT